MRNADLPAMPCGKIDRPAPKGADPLGNYTIAAHGFTKREAVVLEFAKELTQHYSRMCIDGHCSHSGKYHEIMVEAKSMADAYFFHLEE